MTTTQLRCADEAILTGINTTFGCAAGFLLRSQKPFTAGLCVGTATAIAFFAHKILSTLFPSDNYHRMNWGISIFGGCVISSCLFSTSLLTTTIATLASTILTLTLTP